MLGAAPYTQAWRQGHGWGAVAVQGMHEGVVCAMAQRPWRMQIYDTEIQRTEVQQDQRNENPEEMR